MSDEPSAGSLSHEPQAVILSILCSYAFAMEPARYVMYRVICYEAGRQAGRQAEAPCVIPYETAYVV